MSESALSPLGSPAAEENHLIAERREKLTAIRSKGIAFPNDFKPSQYAIDLHREYDGEEGEELKARAIEVRVAGRMMLKRVMGKASFATLQDGSLLSDLPLAEVSPVVQEEGEQASVPDTAQTASRIQMYITRDDVGEAVYSEFKHWDLGDIVAVRGTLFKTKTGELSIHAHELRLLTKSLRPLPDKFHGLADQEQKYRHRYVDLMMDARARQRFAKRSVALATIRNHMLEHGFLEVETPMLHPIPGGANAKPFVTHHNALDQEMYLRIAPELYLKRLIVGGFDKVFEINRSFRNEGISVRHNPEFTMMEFYAAYWNYEDMMQYTEALLRDVTQKAVGATKISYQGHELDLGRPFERLSIREAILRYTAAGERVDSVEWLQQALAKVGTGSEEEQFKEKLAGSSLAALQVLYFEEEVEHQLIQPTFICDHPVEISPLARANDAQPEITERFELYIAGRELANGFSELNDAEDQAARFAAQANAKDARDDEAMFFDADYIRALEYAMPPTGGCGVGIDRLMMLLTDSPSIRDVLLFPALKNLPSH
jgi:lysyl-tRNA synthetase class 2